MQGVLDRFTQIQPKVIFSVEAVRYNNKVHDHLSKLREVVAGLPGLQRVVLFPFCETEDINTTDIPNWWVTIWCPSVCPAYSICVHLIPLHCMC